MSVSPHAAIAIAHVLILGPLLIAIGLGYGASYRAAVGFLGAFIVVYHAYKAYAKISAGVGGAWINWIHVLIVGPALIAYGFTPSPPKYVEDLILMLGFAAVGYHGFNLLAGRT
jgi:hypothetical protein